MNSDIDKMARIAYTAYTPDNSWAHADDATRSRFRKIADALLTAGYINGNKAEWVTLQEAADMVGCSAQTIRRMITAGTIEAKRVGPRLVRVNVQSVERTGDKVRKGYDGSSK